jgi:two-component system cell cycle sensor histidine kinase/response regulator CckA
MADGTPLPGMLHRLLAPDGGPWRELFEIGPWGAALLDRNGRILLANAALAALVGVDAKGRLVDLDFAELFAPAQAAQLGRALARALAGTDGEPAEPVIADLPPTPAGEPQAAAMISFTAIAEPDGRPPEGVVVRVVDVTVQRRLEQQLAHGQKMQAIGELAGKVAHDFNNLLTITLLSVGTALTRAGVPADLAHDLGVIRRASERGTELVSKLLAFGRKQPMQARLIVLNEAIEDVAMLVRTLLSPRCAVVLDLDPPRRVVRIDYTQFVQVIINLAVNARDAMPKGGRFTMRTGQVNLFRPLIRGSETIPPGRYAMVEAADTGNGIPQSHLDRIFEPFFTTKKDSGGTGLGLSTVWGIVRQMEGFVTVDSTPGEGTTFRVYLPRVDAPDEADIRQIAPTPIALPSYNAGAPPARGALLLSEDEDMIRVLAAGVLAGDGWEVIQASSGDEALEVIANRQAPLAALITDMVMPGADGEAVVHAARARWPGLPVMVTSGYAESLGGEGLDRLGVAWLAKPYNMSGLVRAAARLVAGEGVAMQRDAD